MPAANATQRFSNRVDNYVKYRPGYPPAVLDLLAGECGLTPQSIIADVGSGTGILSRMFLAHGNRVFGVEPNREMRQAAEQLLAGYPNFTSVDARAEATTLPEHSVDFVTAGQAFHWFDPPLARAEFQRILRPGGWVVLVWNSRDRDGSPFLQAHEQLLRTYSPEYARVNHQDATNDDVPGHFDPPFQRRTFPNPTLLDWKSLAGRLLSSSYAPLPGDPNFEPMMAGLRQVFDAHQVDGKVTMTYLTEVYFGRT